MFRSILFASLLVGATHNHSPAELAVGVEFETNTVFDVSADAATWQLIDPENALSHSATNWEYRLARRGEGPRIDPITDESPLPVAITFVVGLGDAQLSFPGDMLIGADEPIGADIAGSAKNMLELLQGIQGAEMMPPEYGPIAFAMLGMLAGALSDYNDFSFTYEILDGQSFINGTATN